MPQVSRYHPLLVGLHWLLALMVIAALALGALVLVDIPNSDPMKIDALRQHMTAGVLILALMLVRLLVRTRTTPGSGIVRQCAAEQARLGLAPPVLPAGVRHGRQRHHYGF
jgi:cytochrome b561